MPQHIKGGGVLGTVTTPKRGVYNRHRHEPKKGVLGTGTTLGLKKKEDLSNCS